MTESTAVASASAFYLWSAPDQHLQVYIRNDAIRQLLADAQRGLKLLPRRGAEIGGILLGTAGTSGGTRTVTIHSLELVPCECSAGPTWTLSARERSELEATVRNLRQRYSDLTVVGVYRSHTRAPQGLSAEDLDLYRACFSESHDLFLVVQPLPGGSALVAISYREGGEVRTLPGQFTIGAGAMPAVSAPPLDPVPLAEKTRRLPSRWMLPLVLVLGAALSAATAGLGIFAYQLWRATKAERPGSPLGLRVERRSENLALSWDRGAAAVNSARRGQLTIMDGGSQRQIELSANQVRAGRLVYLAASGAVDLRLEIEQQDGLRVGESVIVVGEGAAAAHPIATVAVNVAEPPQPKPQLLARRAAPLDLPAPEFIPPAEPTRQIAVQELEAPPAVAPAHASEGPAPAPRGEGARGDAAREAPGVSMATFRDVQRVVAIGDVNDSVQPFLKTLQAASLLDGDGRWIGGKTHLVAAEGRVDGPLADLLGKLQTQAESTGGKVHIVVGPNAAVKINDTLFLYKADYRNEEELDRTLRDHGVWRVVTGYADGRPGILPRFHGKLIVNNDPDHLGCLVVEYGKPYALYRGQGLALPADNGGDLQRYNRQVAEAVMR